ncbi:MAG: UDP-N-acetylglucosamine--N-acetylmuramyl-(pentapeptide) pyrophosphoryl-undecaprenol N-acetylglucosamine transferase, partial [Elusimicrobiota bacterium]
MRKKILMVVGGTGGHIYPGIALAQNILSRDSEVEIDFAVDKRPLANKILGEKGFKFHKIDSAPFPRKKFWQICRFIFNINRGFIESVILLKKVDPAVIVAFGAYISVPVVLASSVLKIPVILHEQNYYPGLANRFLTYRAEKVAISYKSSLKYFPPHKTVFTGNPVRKEIIEVTKKEGLEYLNLDENRVT